LVEQAPEWRDGPRSNGHAELSDNDAEIIARLGKLSPLEYERQRKATADQLGCRPPALDAIVKLARGAHSDAGQGRPLDLPSPVPWDDLVDGAELLGALADAIRRHVVLPDYEADAAALWVVHTYLFDVFPVTPRLGVTSPEKRCGKSTLLDVLGCLVPRPLSAANISAAATFRTIELVKPTLLIDEADTFLPDNEDLRGVLNSGHRQGGSVVRLVGDKHEPRKFATHAPVAIALIGTLPGTLADRSIRLRLRRRRADERIAPFRSDRAEHLTQLARMAARWAFDNRERVAESNPNCGQLFNRDADNWRPLLAIADAAGGDWPARARNAAERLVAEAADDQESMGTMLLADIQAMFHDRAVDRLGSQDIVNHLHALEGRPWLEFGRKSKPITQNGRARLLKRFDITPGSVRLGSVATPKGYLLKDFEEAFRCYLLPEGDSEAPHRHKPWESRDSADSQPQQVRNGVALRNRANP
jgi:putative DNA primase/helicase